MKLLVLILNKPEYLGKILHCLLERDICGATVLDSTGMIRVISEQSIEPPPIFGSLRQFLNPSGESSKTVLMVLPENKVEAAKSVIREVTGGFDKPNTGIMFTVPISCTEGVDMV
ncbi:MAG: hypothetical protein BWX78_00855 [Firmicutes bacterium ADurb.Bin099]|nr:MAG: hypothetical protein BWX78_00855 [Firmicutes bacterium ADurb.Bin099]